MPGTPQPISTDDIDNRFDYHRPDTDKVERHQQIRKACKSLAQLVVASCPPGRETSTAVTKIEEAVYWANAAIAREG